MLRCPLLAKMNKLQRRRVINLSEKNLSGLPYTILTQTKRTHLLNMLVKFIMPLSPLLLLEFDVRCTRGLWPTATPSAAGQRVD